MFSITKKFAHEGAVTTCGPIDELLTTSLKNDRSRLHDLLMLKAALDKRENPVYCVETFLCLVDVVEDSVQRMMLERLRLILMTQICMEVQEVPRGEVTFHRILFEAMNIECLMDQFVCRYHGIAFGEEYPGDTEFRLVFIPL